ncbi:MAG: hypothetical protein QM811_12560 [Pirellulales bacterium]
MRGASPAPGHLETWFLLKNESTFPAEILGGEERLKLRMNGGELEIRSVDIQLMGFSLDDLAEQRVQSAALLPADRRWPIVEWCVRNERYAHAERVLDDLAKFENESRRAEGWRRHLERLRAVQPQSASHAKTPAADGRPLLALAQASRPLRSRSTPRRPNHGNCLRSSIRPLRRQRALDGGSRQSVRTPRLRPTPKRLICRLD